MTAFHILLAGYYLLIGSFSSSKDEGIRVFVPGSQLSMRRMGRNEDLSAYVGKELELRGYELRVK